MKASIVLTALWAALAASQQFQNCTRELAATDDCADVINPNACYNQFRFNAQTLQCIDGKDNADRQRKACKCCKCVGDRMCQWVTQNRYCTGTP